MIMWSFTHVRRDIITGTRITSVTEGPEGLVYFLLTGIS